MSGRIRAVTGAAITLIILIILIAAVLPTLSTETATISDNTSYPTMTRTIFELAEWVPVTLIMVGVITAGVGLVRWGRGRRRSRRSR